MAVSLGDNGIGKWFLYSTLSDLVENHLDAICLLVAANVLVDESIIYWHIVPSSYEVA